MSKETFQDLTESLFRVAAEAERDHYTFEEISDAFRVVFEEYRQDN